MIVSRGKIGGVAFEIEDIPHYLDNENSARVLSSENGKISAIWLDEASIIQPYLSEIQTMILSWENGKQPRLALVLGNGCCSIVRFLFRAFAGIQVEGVEKSPEMTDLAKQYFCSGLPLHRLSIVEEDAFDFVARSQLPKYDIIVVDLFDGDDFLERQVSFPFLANLERLLADNSIVAFNLSTASYDSRRKLADNLSRFPFLAFKVSDNNFFAFKEAQ